MLFRTPFREKALAQRARQETVDTRLQVTAPHEWLLVSALGVALIALLIAALVGRAERSYTLDAVLVDPGQRIDVLAGTSGVVVEVFAEVTDTVVADQPIARVRTIEAFMMQDSSLMQDITTFVDGEIVTLELTVGQQIVAGDLAARIRVPAAGPMEAVALLTGDEAARFAPGMDAQMHLGGLSASPTAVVDARVKELSSRVVPPQWLLDLGLEQPLEHPESVHLLRATLEGPESQPIIDGSHGTVRIVVGNHSIASLIFGSGGD